MHRRQITMLVLLFLLLASLLWADDAAQIARAIYEKGLLEEREVRVYSLSSTGQVSHSCDLLYTCTPSEDLTLISWSSYDGFLPHVNLIEFGEAGLSARRVFSNGVETGIEVNLLCKDDQMQVLYLPEEGQVAIIPLFLL